MYVSLTMCDDEVIAYGSLIMCDDEVIAYGSCSLPNSQFLVDKSHITKHFSYGVIWLPSTMYGSGWWCI